MNAIIESVESLAFFLQQAPGVGPSALRRVLRKVQHEDLDPRNLLTFEDWKLQAVLDLLWNRLLIPGRTSSVKVLWFCH
jgi:hypothetical protein